MSVMDFLFQGQPPPSTTTYGESTSNIPTWLSDYTQGLLARANAVAAEPYIPYTAPRIAAPNAQQTQAWNMASSNVGNWQPSFNAAQGALGQATGANPMDAASPWLQQGAAQNPLAQGQQGWDGAAGFGAAAGAGNSYLHGAAGSALGGVNGWMGNYATNAAQEVARLGNENFTNTLMPQIGDMFTKAGHFGSTRHAKELGDTAQRVQRDISGQQATLMNQGWQMAGQNAQADASRMGQVGQQLGQLQLGAGTLFGNLGTAMSGAANNWANTLGNFGQVAGNMTNMFADNQINAATQYGALGRATQAAGINDAAALEAAGSAQRGVDQSHLDLAYNDFTQQRDYPIQQLATVQSALNGIPYSTNTQTSNTGPASVYQPSGLSQIAGALSLYNALGRKRGGRVRAPSGGALKFARGGQVKNKGALSYVC